jgi:hypothetical protein
MWSGAHSAVCAGQVRAPNSCRRARRRVVLEPGTGPCSMRSGAHDAVLAGRGPGAEHLPVRTAPLAPGSGHGTAQRVVRRAARCRLGGARPGCRTPGCQRRPGAHGAVRFGNRARNRAACGPARTVPFGRGGARAPNTCRRARCRAVRKPGTGPRCVQSGQHVAVWAGGGPGEEHLPARTAPCGPEALHGTAQRAVWRARAVWVGRGPYSAVWARPKPNMNVYFNIFHHLSTISTYFTSNSRIERS